MRLEWLTWSSPVAVWWGFLIVVSSANIGLWLLLHRQFRKRALERLRGGLGIELVLALCAAYVLGCAFRSVLPRADVQRICLFDTWLSSVAVGRSVATVAEVCFVIQWAIVLRQLGALARSDRALGTSNAIVPLIVLAECCSWYAVVTTNYLGNAIENSLWAVTFSLIAAALWQLRKELRGIVRSGVSVAIVGIAAYLVFLVVIDVPMYLGRWQADMANGKQFLGIAAGLHDVSTRWIVTRDFAQWSDEIAWMSLYFSGAVWSSLALCSLHLFDGERPRYRTSSERPAARTWRLFGAGAPWSRIAD